MSLVVTGGTRFRTEDARWRVLFDAADLMSEGASKPEGDGDVWYGTTSIVLRLPDADQARMVAFLATRDVHARVRALRLARREAQTRCPQVLGSMASDLRAEAEGPAVRIDVDVKAPLIRSRLGRSRPGS
jgi:hypothetical protein